MALGPDDIPGTYTVMPVACGDTISEVTINEMIGAINGLKGYGQQVFHITDRIVNGARQCASGFSYGTNLMPGIPATPGLATSSPVPATFTTSAIADVASIMDFWFTANGLVRFSPSGGGGWYAIHKIDITLSCEGSSLTIAKLVTDTPYTILAAGETLMPQGPSAQAFHFQVNTVAINPPLPAMRAMTLTIQHKFEFVRGPFATYAPGAYSSIFTLSDRNEYRGILSLSAFFREPFY